MGWENKRRVYGFSIHLDMKDGKIWIQWNCIEIDVAKELVELGVSQEDIVVGFHPVYLCQMTDYAVG